MYARVLMEVTFDSSCSRAVLLEIVGLKASSLSFSSRDRMCSRRVQAANTAPFNNVYLPKLGEKRQLKYRERRDGCEKIL